MALSDDSAYRIEMENNKIKFPERFSIARYNSQMLPVTVFNEFAIRKEVDMMNASVLYRMINLNSKKYFVLSEYADYEKANYNNVQTAMNNAEDEYLTEINKNWMGDIEPKDLPAISQLQQSERNMSFYHLKELSTYLRIARDSIYLFNHEIDSIYVFDKHGNYIRTFPLTYHIKNIHYPDIIVDEEHQHVYYKYVNKDACYLQEIDLNTGKSGKQYKLKKTFPEKIKIRSGIIYFMNNTKEEMENNNLFLQKM